MAAILYFFMVATGMDRVSFNPRHVCYNKVVDLHITSSDMCVIFKIALT